MKTTDARSRRIYVLDGYGMEPLYVTYPGRRLSDKRLKELLLLHLAPLRKEAATIERAFEKDHGMKPKEVELRYERSRREIKKYEKWYEGSRYEQIDRVEYIIDQALTAAGFTRVEFTTTWVNGEAGGDTGLLRSGVENIAAYLERAPAATKRKAPKRKRAR